MARKVARRNALLWAVSGFLLAFIGSWIPSAWRDEAATAWVLSFSVDEILEFTSHTDVVHLAHYLLLKPLATLFGTDPLVLRFPSALAVGVGTAALYEVGRRLGGPKLGAASAIAYLVIPRTLMMGMEARSFAMSSAAVAVAMWALVRQRDSERVWGWVIAAVASALAVLLHLYAALAIVGLFVGSVLISPQRWRAISLTAVLAALPCLPFLWQAYAQSQQLSWIAAIKVNVAEQYLLEAFFPYKTVVRFTQPWEANARVIALILVIVIGILIIGGLISRRIERQILLLAFPALVLAFAGPLLYSALVAPMCVPRYLVSAVPVVALLIAASWKAWPKLPARAVAVVAVALSLVLYVSHRDPRGKFVIDDYKWIATTVKSIGTEGDGLLFDPAPGDPIQSGRNATAAYAAQFEGLIDLARPQTDLKEAWPIDPPMIELSELELPPRILLVSSPPVEISYVTALQEAGFTRTEKHDGPTHTVELWTR